MLIIVMLGLSAAASLACVTIERRVEIEVTPDAMPVETEGARWQELPLHYCMVPTDDGYVSSDRFKALTAQAFERWGIETIADADCDVATAGNRRNEIGWGPSANQEGPGYEAGYTRLYYRSCTRACPNGAQSRITEADILIDPNAPRSFRSERCLLAVLVHETGHFLGLPHLASPAIMAPVSSDCDSRPTDADREALDQLYPSQ